MLKKLFVCFGAALALAAAAEKKTVRLFEDSVVNGMTLKPGEYRLLVENGKATFMQGAKRVEASVTVESTPAKFSATTVRYDVDGGRMRISEIHLGGTNSKVVFQAPGAPAGAGGQK